MKDQISGNRLIKLFVCTVLQTHTQLTTLPWCKVQTSIPSVRVSLSVLVSRLSLLTTHKWDPRAKNHTRMQNICTWGHLVGRAGAPCTDSVSSLQRPWVWFHPVAFCYMSSSLSIPHLLSNPSFVLQGHEAQKAKQCLKRRRRFLPGFGDTFCLFWMDTNMTVTKCTQRDSAASPASLSLFMACSYLHRAALVCYLDMNPLMVSFSAGLPGTGANMSLILTQPAVPMPTTTAPNMASGKQTRVQKSHDSTGNKLWIHFSFLFSLYTTTQASGGSSGETGKRPMACSTASYADPYRWMPVTAWTFSLWAGVTKRWQVPPVSTFDDNYTRHHCTEG